MKITLKETLNNNKFILILSAFSAVFFVMATLFGDLFAAVCGSILAVLWRIDNIRHIPSIVVSLIGITVDILLNGPVPIVSIQTLVIASILCFMTFRRVEKSFLAAVMTVALTALTFISFILLAMKVTGSYDFESVKTYYENLYLSTRGDFVSAIRDALSNLSSAYKDAADIMTSTDLELMFDSLVSGLVSLIVIYAFLISGIAIKIFCRVASAVSKEEKEISEWSFTTSNVFCYFYIVLFFAVAFVSGTEVLAIALENLYNIFLVVYAYIGLRAEYRLLRSKVSVFPALLIIFGQFIILSFIVLQVLSIFGVLGTISKNKMSGRNTPPDVNA